MLHILRPQDTLKMAVRLESLLGKHTRYMAIVSTNGRQDNVESVILGIDYVSADQTTIGLVLPIWASTSICLDGDGGISVESSGSQHIFKPVSVQAMWSAFQSLHKEHAVARSYPYFPGGLTHTWAQYYETRISSPEACRSEWHYTFSDDTDLRADSLRRHCFDKPPERTAAEKLIRVKLKDIMQSVDLDEVTSKDDLTDTTDISALAREIVDKCKLIPVSKVPEVEQLLYYLQKRDTKGDQGSRLKTDFSDIVNEIQERASVNKLDDYIEMLYEDIPEKVRGTALVLQLARNPDNLEELMQNETLLGALARVLREDWKKNMELATNIAYAFFCFSTFSQFHSMISHFKVGALCMQIIEYELKRYDLWKEDLEQKTNSHGNSKDVDGNRRKFFSLVKKQEQLLRVTLYLLLNLSEDLKTEVKMVNRGIVEMLCKILNRKENTELLILAATFIKKLSIFYENIRQLCKGGMVEKVGKILPSAPDDLAGVILQLLLNVSFDTEMRKKIVSCGLLNHIVPHCANAAHREVSLKLLYHLSMDDSCKAMFTYTDCISLVKSMGLMFELEECPLALKSLLVNLAVNKRNAQLLAGDEGTGLKLLVELAFQKSDPLILKILRNIAEHDGTTKPMFIEFISDFAEAVVKNLVEGTKCLNNFGLECLGILACMNLSELDWARLLHEYQLVSWIRSSLKSGVSEDDVVLEIVVLLGTVATDQGGAELLLKEGLVDSLIALLSAKQEDDEIVLQIIYVFYQMMFHDHMRKKLLADTQVPAYLIDLMHDKNPEVRKMCDNTLDVIAEHGDEWAKKIQEEKFRWHNAQWLDMVAEKPGDFEENSYEPDIPLDGYERADVFEDMYGLQAEDILENYENENRPFSRLGYQNSTSSEDVDNRIHEHPFR